MRRTHLRGRENILKRQLIHVCAFNLSLIFRLSLGAGTPRELRNRQAVLISAFLWLHTALMALPDVTELRQCSWEIPGCHRTGRWPILTVYRELLYVVIHARSLSNWTATG